MSNSRCSTWVAFAFAFAIGVGSASQAVQLTLISKDGLSTLEVEIGAGAKSLEISEGLGAQAKRVCALSRPISQLKSSSDGSAVIVSANEYLSYDTLRSCSGAAVVPNAVPLESGMLVDVNVRHALYLALLPVSVQPMSYLGVIAKIGTSKNLINLPGAYVGNQPLKRQQSNAFSYSGEGSAPQISIGGRYVSVSGVIDCSEDSYPGVWDLETGREIVIRDVRRQ